MAQGYEDLNAAKRISNFIKQNNKTISLTLGEVSNLVQIGQGGNGLVYAGVQNKQEVAIKFLVEEKQSSKLQRFKAEYFNINLMEDRSNIVNYINYEEIQFENGYSIPAIVMKKYDRSLKKLRVDIPEIDEDTFLNLFDFLLNTLEKIHEKGIIHRDIKPENILVTKDMKFILTDFGIASYNPELYTLKAQTERGERLANYEFSAPEQAYKDAVPAPSMDIYALGQVCQWYIFGTTHRGTNRRSITEIFQSNKAKIIEEVLYKCLYNDHEQRYQNVSEIREHINEMKEARKKVDPYREMRLLNDVIRATCPSISKEGIQFVEDEKYIKRFVENIRKQKFKLNLQFNTGKGDNSFKEIKYLGNKTILLDYKELKLNGIWLFTNYSLYDDLILFDIAPNEPFVIDGEETYYALKINDEHLVGAHYLESGYIEIGDEVYNLEDVKVEEHYRSNDYDYMAIGTKFHCSMLIENDLPLRNLHGFASALIDKNAVMHLVKKIRENIHEEVQLGI